MNYEYKMEHKLAKQLKDAGFPIRNSNMPDDWYDRYSMWWPILSELIEACGNRFEYLKKVHQQTGEREISDRWEARGLLSEPDDYFTVIDVSPEEAVANLWLAINKKV